MSIFENEGLVTKTWENVRGDFRFFAVYVWHSEGWTPRSEALMDAVVKQAPNHQAFLSGGL